RGFHSTSTLHKRVIKPFFLADIGEGIAECEVVKWLVKPPKELERFDPICEVQSDKASVELTSPFDGNLVKTFCEQGEIVKVGSKLCEFEVEEDVLDEEAQEDVKPAEEEHRENQERGELEVKEQEQEDAKAEENVFVLATPAVRRVAREEGVNLSKITGTGKGGRITKEDVFAAASGASPSAPSSGSAPAPTQSGPAVSYQTPSFESHSTSSAEPVSRPLSTVRRAMYKAMTSSLSIPHFTYSDEIDVTELEKMRLKLNKSIPSRFKKELSRKEKEPADRVPEGSRFDRLTMLPLFVKALSYVLRDHPIFRSKLVVPDGQLEKATLLESPKGLISLALSSPLGGGLFTPCLPNVGDATVFEVASTIAYLQSLALASPTPKFPEPFRTPGTITLSNIGSIGGTYTHPVIPPGGQLAIGALGKAKVLPRYVGKEQEIAKREAVAEYEGEEASWEPRLIMNVSFSGDHRVVEGMELAMLVKDWKELVENPENMIGL
ncbi:CoA-dependent acyltransferase, partial [Atractiella rhizophila]